MEKFRLFLQGKKTYLVVVVLLLLALAQWAGIEIPGVTLDTDPVTLLLTALGLGGLRAAIAKK